MKKENGIALITLILAIILVIVGVIVIKSTGNKSEDSKLSEKDVTMTEVNSQKASSSTINEEEKAVKSFLDGYISCTEEGWLKSYDLIDHEAAYYFRHISSIDGYYDVELDDNYDEFNEYEKLLKEKRGTTNYSLTKDYEGDKEECPKYLRENISNGVANVINNMKYKIKGSKKIKGTENIYEVNVYLDYIDEGYKNFTGDYDILVIKSNVGYRILAIRFSGSYWRQWINELIGLW